MRTAHDDPLVKFGAEATEEALTAALRRVFPITEGWRCAVLFNRHSLGEPTWHEIVIEIPLRVFPNTPVEFAFGAGSWLFRGRWCPDRGEGPYAVLAHMMGDIAKRIIDDATSASKTAAAK